MNEQHGAAVTNFTDYAKGPAEAAPLHPLTRALLAELASIDERIRANADAEQIEMTLYVSRGWVARKPELRER